jgi:hypothetical protein
MAKEPRTRKSEAETPFQQFQRLARRIVSVPKEKARTDESDSPQPQS